MLFPLAYVATTSSLTILLICVGVLGDPALAADLAIAQGAVIATYYAFSSNARNLILQRQGAMPVADVLRVRIAFIVPLGVLSYLLSVSLADVAPYLAGAVIVRRSCEWLGEVHLSGAERDGKAAGVRRYMALQMGSLGALAVVVAAIPTWFPAALWAWAWMPVVGMLRPLGALGAGSASSLSFTLRALLPHAGSTLIAGVSIYLLRLIIVLVTEREFAGLLFTAVAIGSFTGSLFANVLGPSLAMHGVAERRPPLLLGALLAVTVLGVLIALLSDQLAGLPLGKPAYFWESVGLSLLGSAVMIEAQRLRLALFDRGRGDELFAPDVLRNLTLMIAAPALAVVFSRELLASVYLLDALLTWVFYASAYRHAIATTWLPPRGELILRWLIGLLLVFPIFVQLKGAIYHSPGEPMLDSGGRIVNLPLPVSLAACFAGTLLFARFIQARLAMAFVFSFFAAMALTSVAATGGEIDYGSRKLLLLLQFLLPTFGLILGQMYAASHEHERSLAHSMLYTIAVFVPLQLALTWAQGRYLLTHDIGLFSVYQHRQYVPVVFVAAYLYALAYLWDSPRDRVVLSAMGVFMTVYAVISYSTLALGMLLIGVALFALTLNRTAARIAIVAACLVVAAGGLWGLRNTIEFQQKYVPDAVEAAAAGSSVLPENVRTRLRDWTLYGMGILEGPYELFFGHRDAFDRTVSTSAHNYYLDFIYNFGIIAALPLGWLIAYTLSLIRRNWRAILASRQTLGVVFVVLFLVLIDNSFKVNMRQPYPGVFTFFVWGLLLSRLLRIAR